MNDLSAINWEEVSGNCDVNKSFSHLYKTMNHVVNKHAPLRDASVRKLKMLTKPWLTARLRKSIKVKTRRYLKTIGQFLCYQFIIVYLRKFYIVG